MAEDVPTLGAKLATLVGQIPAKTPEELERKLELLSKAGTLSEVERKLGFLSAFDANLVKLLHRIPAKNHHELEQKIASLIPKKTRAAAVAEAKEASWRGYDSYLVNLARRIPAVDPAELVAKIASLTLSDISMRISNSFPLRATFRFTPGDRIIDRLMTMLGGAPPESRRQAPRADGPSPADAPGISMSFTKPARPGISLHEENLDLPSGPHAEENDAAPAAMPDQPFFTRLEHLAPFGPRCERVDKLELAAIARRTVGGAIDLSFPRFVSWLNSEGYRFGGFEEGPPEFDARYAYLRYDVHIADLLAAYVLADWHERLRIVGSFQILWKFSRDQEEAEPYFVKLMEFDRRFVQFGLHLVPTATWYLYEKLGIDAAVEGIVDNDAFAEWVLDLYSAYSRDGDNAPALQEIRQGTDDTVSRIATSFRATFGAWKSVSGHGNFLTKGFNKVLARHPEVDVLRPYFYPEAYFAKWGLARFGFDCEITSFGSDPLPFPRVLYEGSPEAMRRTWYRGRVAHAAGFVALLHPATWTCRKNAAFFLPEDEADLVSTAARGDV